MLVAGPLVALLVAGTSSPAFPATLAHGNNFTVTNLVSDQAGHALTTDPNLVNAWGLAASPSSPWWVADNGTDLSTLYDGDGNIVQLVVGVKGAPTGTVFNGGTGFVVHHKGNAGPSVFLFATESGTILGWNPNVPPPPPSTKAFVVANRSGEGAIYKGLAIASTNDGDFLYATDFHNARVDMFDSSFHLVTPPDGFKDPDIPHHYAPFGIQNIGGVLFVTYAKQDADGEDDVPGKGHGFIDMYDTSGALMGRVASRGALDSPWGLTLAPDSFGRFGGDLLVGNFGNGRINVYAPHQLGARPQDESFDHVGMLKSNGNTIGIDGLWALQFGNGGGAGSTDTLFFTAGPGGEAHGLFGKIEAAG
jgi:uncharacterized protein (TIGR03118 family)